MGFSALGSSVGDGLGETAPTFGLAVAVAVGVGVLGSRLANSFGVADGVAVSVGRGVKVGVGKGVGVLVGVGVSMKVGVGDGAKVILFTSWACLNKKTAIGMTTKRTSKKPIVNICLCDKGLNACGLGKGWGGVSSGEGMEGSFLFGRRYQSSAAKTAPKTKKRIIATFGTLLKAVKIFWTGIFSILGQSLTYVNKS